MCTCTVVGEVIQDKRVGGGDGVPGSGDDIRVKREQGDRDALA